LNQFQTFLKIKMFCKKAVIMLSYDLCFKFILCKNVNKFLKYYDVINDLFKSVDHEDAEVDFDVMRA
jgi:hypothetical protein